MDPPAKAKKRRKRTGRRVSKAEREARKQVRLLAAGGATGETGASVGSGGGGAHKAASPSGIVGGLGGTGGLGGVGNVAGIGWVDAPDTTAVEPAAAFHAALDASRFDEAERLCHVVPGAALAFVERLGREDRPRQVFHYVRRLVGTLSSIPEAQANMVAQIWPAVGTLTETKRFGLAAELARFLAVEYAACGGGGDNGGGSGGTHTSLPHIDIDTTIIGIVRDAAEGCAVKEACAAAGDNPVALLVFLRHTLLLLLGNTAAGAAVDWHGLTV